jgi:hypothetical protein
MRIDAAGQLVVPFPTLTIGRREYGNAETVFYLGPHFAVRSGIR